MSEVKKATASNSYITNKLNYDPNNLDKIYNYLIDRTHGYNGIYEYYILSLTHLRDSLFHWKNFYDTGCSLGFNSNLFGNWINIIHRRPFSPKMHFKNMDCIYLKDTEDEKDKERERNEIEASISLQNELDIIINDLKNDPTSKDYFVETNDPEIQRLHQFQINPVLERELTMLSLQIKKHQYYNEQEYRLVIDNTNYPRLLINQKHCIELPMHLNETAMITEIMMAPNASIEDEEKIKDLIERKGLHINTHRSKFIIKQ